MARNPDKCSMEGASRELSILFYDVQGFAKIARGPELRELSNLMNEFLTALTQVIYRYRGTIDKCMGDAIMAFWGASLSDAEHARQALLAGPEAGHGVNAVRASLGNVGSRLRVAYTVMSNVGNTTSRPEGLTKQYGVGMTFGQDMRAACPDFVFGELDRVRPKGKHEPLAIYEPIGLAGQVDKARQDKRSLWRQALKQYPAQEWDLAKLRLINRQRRHPKSPLSSGFLERLGYFRKAPPGKGWGGTCIAESE